MGVSFVVKTGDGDFRPNSQKVSISFLSFLLLFLTACENLLLINS